MRSQNQDKVIYQAGALRKVYTWECSTLHKIHITKIIILQDTHAVTLVRDLEVTINDGKVYSINDLTMKSNYTLYPGPVDRDTHVHVYSACVDSCKKLVNKESHVAFLMEEQVSVSYY